MQIWQVTEDKAWNVVRYDWDVWDLHNGGSGTWNGNGARRQDVMLEMYLLHSRLCGICVCVRVCGAGKEGSRENNNKRRTWHFGKPHWIVSTSPAVVEEVDLSAGCRGVTPHGYIQCCRSITLCYDRSPSLFCQSDGWPSDFSVHYLKKYSVNEHIGLARPWTPECIHSRVWLYWMSPLIPKN